MNQPNWSGNILIFFKQGDQDIPYGGYRHNEPISYIDLLDWFNTHGSYPIISESNKDTIAFATLLLPRSELQNIKDVIETNNVNKKIEIGNPHKNIDGELVFDEKQRMGRILLNSNLSIFDSVRDNWLAKNVRVEPLEITENSFSELLITKTSQELGSPNISDNNAWTIGAVTFGGSDPEVPGVHYLLRSNMYADIGTATGDMSATQLDDITDIGCWFKPNLSSYNYTETGNWFKSIFTTVTSYGEMFDVNPLISGTATFENLYLIGDIINKALFAILPQSTSTGKIIVKNSKFTKSNNISAVDVGLYNIINYYNDEPTVSLFNLIFDNLYIGMNTYQVKAVLIENSIFKDCNIGLMVRNPPCAITVNNTSFINNELDFDKPYYDNAYFYNCTTDLSAWEQPWAVNSYLNVDYTNEFESMDISATNAFKVKSSGILATNGISGLFPENTVGFYGTSRPAADGLYSIGVDEHIPQIIPPTFSSTDNPDGSKNIILSCLTLGVSIYYTLDGTTPTSSSNLYSSSFIIYGNTTIKAIGIGTGYIDSTIASQTFNFSMITYFVDFDVSSAPNFKTNDPLYPMGVAEFKTNAIYGNHFIAKGNLNDPMYGLGVTAINLYSTWSIKKWTDSKYVNGTDEPWRMNIAAFDFEASYGDVGVFEGGIIYCNSFHTSTGNWSYPFYFINCFFKCTGNTRIQAGNYVPALLISIGSTIITNELKNFTAPGETYFIAYDSILDIGSLQQNDAPFEINSCALTLPFSAMPVGSTHPNSVENWVPPVWPLWNDTREKFAIRLWNIPTPPNPGNVPYNGIVYPGLPDANVSYTSGLFDDIRFGIGGGYFIPQNPVITPNGGITYRPGRPFPTVSISCQTSGAGIYYTSDGSDPTGSGGILYTAPFVVSGPVPSSTTVKSISFEEDLEIVSDIVSAEFQFADISKLAPVLAELGKKFRMMLKKKKGKK